jgi:hypothetical protein
MTTALRGSTVPPISPSGLAPGANAPVIDGIPVRLGDIVTGPEAGCMEAGRVRGWSPDGRSLYVGWLGVVRLEDVRWCTVLPIAAFPRLYRPVRSNQWGEAVAWGLVENLPIVAISALGTHGHASGGG